MLSPLATVTLETPWAGKTAPTIDVKSFHADAYFEQLFSNVVNPLFTIFTENIAWMVLAICIILVPAVGAALWSVFGDHRSVFKRAYDAQTQDELEALNEGRL